MARLIALAVVLVTALAAAIVPVRAETESRVVIALHDGEWATSSLALAGPALHHLGLVLEPHLSGEELPDLSKRTDIRGVVIWLDEGHIANGAVLTEWVRRLTARDIPVVLAGRLPEAEDRFGLFVSLGLLYSRDARAYTYDLRAVDRDPDMVDYERRFDNLFPQTDIVRPLDPTHAHSLLVLQRRSDVPDRTHPLIVTAKGGYLADGYAVWRQGTEHRWMIDPVAFFRAAFRLDGVPALDPTTVNGRRLFTPRLAPATPDDKGVLDDVRPATERVVKAGELVVLDSAPVRAWDVALPHPEQLCHDRARASWFSYEGWALAFESSERPYRLAAFAPTFLVCAPDAADVPRAMAEVFGYAATLPLTPDQGLGEAMEKDFAGAALDRVSRLTWRVRDRGAVQTVRFDDAEGLRIAWPLSDGVLGGGRVGASLYVSLDPDANEPVIALTEAPWAPPPFPALVESRWMISQLVRDAERAKMKVTGFGRGDMVWSVPPGSTWEVRLTHADGALRRWRAEADKAGRLSFSLAGFADGQAMLELVRRGGATP